MNTYECMYILQTNLSDDETEKASERITEEIEKRGGSMRQRERLGKKRLAYRLGRHDDGTYYLMYFDLPPGEITALRAAYKLHPRLLRYLILRREPEEIVKVHKRPPREAPAREPAADTGAEEEQDKAVEAKDESEPAKPPDAPPDEEAPTGTQEETEPEKQE